MMPKNLVLVRHGQSEANIAQKAAKGGDDTLARLFYRQKHDSQFRLTEQGISQAKSAGEWLKEHFPCGFGRYCTSEYIRAMETAANLKLPDASWYVEVGLRERSYGIHNLHSIQEHEGPMERWSFYRKLSPLHWTPVGGESLAQKRHDVRAFLDTLHRECSDKDVLVVCHGEVMWVFRLLLERMTDERFRELDESENPHDRIHNGQIIHYTRQDPFNKNVSNHLGWMRSVCPSNSELSTNDWQQIIRPRFSNDELASRINTAPRLL